MSNEYKIFMSKESADYFDAVVKHQFQPTEETKKRVEQLSNEISEKVRQSQLRAETAFINLYGEQILTFVKKISKENFLAAKNHPYYLSWTVKEDLENDNYWCVSFYKGEFKYVLESCSGYGGSETIEGNISQDRVLELLKTKA